MSVKDWKDYESATYAHLSECVPPAALMHDSKTTEEHSEGITALVRVVTAARLFADTLEHAIRSHPELVDEQEFVDEMLAAAKVQNDDRASAVRVVFKDLVANGVVCDDPGIVM